MLIAMAPKILKLAIWPSENFNLKGWLKKMIMIENEEEYNIFIIILFHQHTPSDNIKTLQSLYVCVNV